MNNTFKVHGLIPADNAVSFSLLPLTSKNTAKNKIEIIKESEAVEHDGLEHIRAKYNVPCYIGSYVQYHQSENVTRLGIVVGAFRKDKILVLLDGDEIAQPFHPLCSLSYQASTLFSMCP